MSSIITSILSSTVGLLFNKARDKAAAQFKDGDITDAKIREIVVRELNDIKTKLDGISRKDLLSSYRFLKEGVDLLNVSLDKAKDEKKAVLNEAQDASGETSRMPSIVESGILNEALQLSYAMGKLKIHSEEFLSAKKRFEEARKRATDAFCNEALSIEDRILAAKFRVISEILECLETPGTAVTGCLSFLREFHSLPAIREMFSVYLNGGVKSLLNKAERVENVKSVMLINYVLFQFVWKFSNHEYPSLYAWPTIELSDRSFYPILNWLEISTRKSMTMGAELTQPPKCDVLLDEYIDSTLPAVNSHGEIVSPGYGDDIKAISKTGESKVFKLPDLREARVITRRIAGLAVDKSNNVYVVKWIETRTENGEAKGHVLYVLDENYNVKHDCRFNFFETSNFDLVKMAVNKNNDIIMMKDYASYVCVCDNTGQLKHKFERDSRRVHMNLGITDKNEIMIPSADGKTVHIYTEQGDMKSSIKVPEGHVVRSGAFHYAISKIIVLSFFIEQHSYFLLCYSETGELETSTFFCKGDSVSRWPDITSHPGGPVAVVTDKTITFI